VSPDECCSSRVDSPLGQSVFLEAKEILPISGDFLLPRFLFGGLANALRVAINHELMYTRGSY